MADVIVIIYSFFIIVATGIAINHIFNRLRQRAER
jgi:hypothetical protein